MTIIQMTIKCPACKGTGIYSGMGEGLGVGIICHKCNGSGAYKYSFSYENFIHREIREDIERVYLSGYGYKIGLGKINFYNIGKIDMNKEGVSYQDFLKGERPKHIEKLACPMLADQSECQNREGFIKECNQLNDGWIGYISDCKYQINKDKCWTRFKNYK